MPREDQPQRGKVVDGMGPLIDDARWVWFDVTPAFVDERAVWLCEARDLHGSSLRFFEIAGSLIRFSRYNYPLASVAFFHAILGLEKALRIHFGDEDKSLRNLLTKAHEDGTLSKAELENLPTFSEPFARSISEIGVNKAATRLDTLVLIVPELRNQYVHGTYLLAPDYLHLAFQLRQMADTLNTKSTRLR